ncbi:AI-2E family transporter [Telluribacter humicola]|uniref:AI-2E family transporter n=1 Tax=Telluribacter humicola TaxID=1720261 RepID=UPI001A976B43|nr:AI-2E family transporter [Telluribacter humicola]
MNSDTTPHHKQETNLTQRRLIALGMFLLVVFLLARAFNVLLLILAGTLFAVYFRGTSNLLTRHTKLSDGLSLGIVIVGTLLLLGGLVWLLAPQISQQISQLSQHLPNSYEKVRTQLKGTSWGEPLLNNLPQNINLSDINKSWIQKSMGVFSATFGVLADMYIILFIGAFFTAQPGLYKEGIVLLFPLSKRPRAAEVLNTLGSTLYKWLLGKLFSMLIVGVFTIVGLYLIGIPMALALGIIAGLLSFIPNFGPILALIPAVLIALTQGTSQALYVVLLYVGIQFVESNLITPLVQHKMVEIPPAMVIISQVFIAAFAGLLGLILATPIAVIIMVLVKMVYIQDYLGDKNIQISK